MLLGIYTLGVILAYIILRYIGRTHLGYNYGDVVLNLFLSLASWYIIFVLYVVQITDKLRLKKPPKWL